MPHVIALLAAASFATQSPGQTAQAYTARLGVPYLLGPRAVVSGSKEELDIGIRRWVTLHSVRTAIACGMEGRTFVAREGKKLVIFRATIKNPGKMAIGLHDSETFGLRVFDSGGKAGDFNFLGASDETLGRLDKKLEKGQSGEVITVYEFPAASPNLRVGLYFDRYLRDTAPKFDLTKRVAKPTSVFAKDALTYVSAATVPVGQSFDFDDLEFKVGPPEAIEGGFQVRVEVKNPMRAPGRWGWQYAKAELTGEGFEPTAYYPDFFVTPEFSDWRNELPPGKTVVGHYRFFPTKAGTPKSFTLTMHATKRSVTVVF